MKFDLKCEEGKQAKETMEQYMYTYLNQRYGLKNLIIEWAAAIISGIKKFSKEDHDVALFGKILRNECDEEFRFIQQTVKETVFALLKAVLREKYPNKSEDHLQKLHDSIVADSVDKWQWRKIIEKMYDEEDFRQLEAQINYRIGLQRDQVKYDASQWAVDGPSRQVRSLWFAQGGWVYQTAVYAPMQDRSVEAAADTYFSGIAQL